ncbi:MAG: hypothetical protein AABW72_02725 [archaeon]|mgnify:CR=1 FL=1
MVYTGPVVFIVHSPLPHSEKEGEKVAHLAKMRKVIDFANKNNLPVIFGQRGVKHREDWPHGFIFDLDLTTAISPENAAEFRALTDACKTKKVIVSLAEDFIGNETESNRLTRWGNAIKEGLRTAKINPTKVILAGWYREICMNRASRALRELLPKAELIELIGDYSLSKLRHSKAARQMGFKQDHKTARKELGIKRRPLARKILG